MGLGQETGSGAWISLGMGLGLGLGVELGVALGLGVELGWGPNRVDVTKKLGST